MKRREWNYTFEVVCHDGSRWECYQVAPNRREAERLAWDELDDRARDYVKRMVFLAKEAIPTAARGQSELARPESPAPGRPVTR